MKNGMKVFFYIDKDGHKTNFLSIESKRDLRGHRIMNYISEELERCGLGNKGTCDTLAYDLAHNGQAQVTNDTGTYTLGIDDVPVVPTLV